MEKGEYGQSHGSIRSYIVGFLLSLILTFAAFIISTKQLFVAPKNIYAILLLAVGQAYIQLVFFLHMNRESKPRWNMMAFGFMVLVVAIIVVGSLWIMNNLTYNTMPQMDLHHQ